MSAVIQQRPARPYIILADAGYFRLYDRRFDHEIKLQPLARALSKTCRFCGHLKDDVFYSVAQHSVFVSHLVEGHENQKWGLLHDLSEAYLNDIPRPFKPEINGYKTIEAHLTKILADRFDLEGEMPEAVHRADMTMLITEGRDLCAGDDWMNWDTGYSDLKPLLATIHPLEHQAAFKLFMDRAEELGIR